MEVVDFLSNIGELHGPLSVVDDNQRVFEVLSFVGAECSLVISTYIILHISFSGRCVSVD